MTYYDVNIHVRDTDDVPGSSRQVTAKMATADDHECLATFLTRVRGVRFYAAEEIEENGDGWHWLRADLKRDPGNRYVTETVWR